MEYTELYKKKAEAFTQAEDILKQCEQEKRALNEDEKGRYKLFLDEMQGYDETISEMRKLDEIKSREAIPLEDAKGRRTGELAGERGAEMNKALEKFVRTGAGALEEKERSILGLAKSERGLSVNLRATAGVANPTYAIDTELSKTLDLYKQYYAGWFDACTTVNTQKGNTIYFPEANDTAVTGSLEAAGTDMIDSGTALTLARLQLDAYPYSSLGLVVGNDSLEDWDVPLDVLIWNPLSIRLWKAISAAFTTGDGSSKPDGIVTNAGVGEVITKNSISAADFYSLMRKPNYAYTMGPKAGFMMNSDTMYRTMALSVGSSDDRPLWQPSFAAGQPATIAGKPYWINNDMATISTSTGKVLLFGDFSQHLIRFVGQPKLVRLDERYAELYQTAFIILWRVDCDTLAAGSSVKYGRTLGT